MTTTDLVTGRSAGIARAHATEEALPEKVPGDRAAGLYTQDGTSSVSEGERPASQSPALRASQVIEISKLGYPAQVANQIVESYPNLAAEIIKLARDGTRIPRVGPDRWSYFYHGDLAAEPVTLYRGINAEVVESDRTNTSARLPTELSFNYFSPVLRYPIMRALWGAGGDGASRTRGVITELVVPKYLVFGDYHPSLYQDHWNTYVSGMHPVVLMDMVPDLLPFAHRVGVVPYTREAAVRSDTGDESLIHWQAPGELEPFLVSKSGPHEPIRTLVPRPARWLETPQPRNYAEHVGAPNVVLSFV